MKITLKPNPHANALVIAIILIAIIGIDLASYLSLVRGNYRSNWRSLSWNMAISLAEAGAEEAMAHLNQNGTNGLGTQGWTLDNGYYWMTRTLGDGYYTVGIQSGNSNPVIEAKGYAGIPGAIASAPGPFYAAVGVPAPAPSPTYILRHIRIATTNAPLFSKALVAKATIDLHGNNVYSDSFDSLNPLYSTNGLYIQSKRRDNGDIATISGLTNSVAVGNANIYGNVATGPGGSMLIGPNGVVGSLAYINGGGTGVQPGHFSDDMNVWFKDVDPPFATAPPPPANVTIGGTNYDYVLGNGDYQLSSLNYSGQNSVLVNGSATLYVTGNFGLSGQATLIIAPNATLKLYIGGSADFTGQAIVNNTGRAVNVQFYGLPTCTSFKISGNGTFTGVVYAPSASFENKGNGDYVGAVVCRDAVMTGNGNFHYDESLGRNGPRRGFVPIDWREL